MMDSKLLLVESILLMYRECQLEETNRSNALIREVEATIKMPEATMETSAGRDSLMSLRTTLNFMLEQPTTYKFNKEHLLQRLRVNVGGEVYLYEIIKDGMEDLDEKEQIEEECKRYRNSLYTYLRRNKLRDVIRESSRDMLFEEDKIDWANFAGNLMERLEPFSNGMGEDPTSEAINEVDLSDLDAVGDIFEEGQKEASVEGVMVLARQGMNRMCGTNGGLARGESILVGALQHKYKTGLLLDIPRQVAMCNTPFMLEKNKKPLIVHISLENNVSGNILKLYGDLIGHETKQWVDTRLVDKNEAAAYVKERISANGYHFKMYRFEGSNFTYRKFYDLMDGLLKDGYEIHLISLDYLLLMSDEGCTSSIEAFKKRELLRRLRDYCNPKKITFVTAAQFDSRAKALESQGVECFVKEVAERGMYAECKGLDQEPDMEINIHIEKPGDGYSYLTLMRGKHRTAVKDTPERDRFTVYRFEEYGLPEDINGKDLSRRSVGGSLAGDPGGAKDAWFKVGSAM